MPALVAAMLSNIGESADGGNCSMAATASTKAINAPVMLAVRVPPSASSTSQSTVIICSPRASMSTIAHRLRPISR